MLKPERLFDNQSVETVYLHFASGAWRSQEVEKLGLGGNFLDVQEFTLRDD